MQADQIGFDVFDNRFKHPLMMEPKWNTTQASSPCKTQANIYKIEVHDKP